MNAYKIKSDDYKKYEKQFRKTWVGYIASLSVKAISSLLLLPFIFGIYDSYLGEGNNFPLVASMIVVVLLFILIAAFQYFNMVINYINSEEKE